MSQQALWCIGLLFLGPPALLYFFAWRERSRGDASRPDDELGAFEAGAANKFDKERSE